MPREFFEDVDRGGITIRKDIAPHLYFQSAGADPVMMDRAGRGVRKKRVRY
ncbi:hypothetical protein [Salipiger abyssi]|uniref:hypothetical protein n=1 Tax=Salipiger abyssi TaxID=1250539 RepID=UPI001A8ED0B8|nr:hypothetical protein [Salipiger abyssi]MBN9886747.1 hypothetical protein [Salipiger abyssi]